MSKKYPRRICGVCGSNYPREQGTKRACSEECRSKLTVKRCKEGCKEFEDMNVTFINGETHIKRVCKICRRGNYVPRDMENKHIHLSAKEISKTQASLEIQKRKIDLIQNKMKEKFGDTFYTTRRWLMLRYEVLQENGAVCSMCGSTQKPMHVDHIRPRSKYPELALEKSNLQVLCKDCNLGKWNLDYPLNSGNIALS